MVMEHVTQSNAAEMNVVVSQKKNTELHAKMDGKHVDVKLKIGTDMNATTMINFVATVVLAATKTIGAAFKEDSKQLAMRLVTKITESFSKADKLN